MNLQGRGIFGFSRSVYIVHVVPFILISIDNHKHSLKEGGGRWAHSLQAHPKPQGHVTTSRPQMVPLSNLTTN